MGYYSDVYLLLKKDAYAVLESRAKDDMDLSLLIAAADGVDTYPCGSVYICWQCYSWDEGLYEDVRKLMEFVDSCDPGCFRFIRIGDDPTDVEALGDLHFPVFLRVVCTVDRLLRSKGVVSQDRIRRAMYDTPCRMEGGVIVISSDSHCASSEVRDRCLDALLAMAAVVWDCAENLEPCRVGSFELLPDGECGVVVRSCGGDAVHIHVGMHEYLIITEALWLNVSPSEALSYEWRYCDRCERAMPATLMHSAVCCKACFC